MLEEATPRAQLHLQRILSGCKGNSNGASGAITPATLQRFPRRGSLSKYSGKCIVSPTLPSSQRNDSQYPLVAWNSNSHRHVSKDARTHLSKRNGSLPHHKSAVHSPIANRTGPLEDPVEYSLQYDFQKQNLLLDVNGKIVSARRQRSSAVSNGNSSRMQEFTSNASKKEHTIIDKHPSCLITMPLKVCLAKVDEDETFFREFICKMSDDQMEMLWKVKCHGERTIKQLGELTSMVAQVDRFVHALTEGGLDHPEEHLNGAKNPMLNEPHMSFKEALLALEQIPMTLAANHGNLISSSSDICEVNDHMPIIPIPHPHPQLALPFQQAQQSTVPHDATLCVRQPSSLLSRCGSVQASASRPYQTRSGAISPHGALMNGSLESGEDMLSSTTFVANMALRQRERDVDTAWVMENLQEENIYWQEEALRATLESDRYLHILQTILGLQLSSPINGNGELDKRRASVMTIVPPTQKPSIYRLFVQLVLEQEEGERNRIKSQEAQEWWNLWFSIWETLSHVFNTSKKNGKNVNSHQMQLPTRKKHNSSSRYS